MTPKRNAKKSAPSVKSTFKKARQPATPVERKVIAYVQRKNPAMMEITMALRVFIKKTVPKSRELLNPWGLPTYEWRGAIGYIMITKKHVTFGFARGSELPDPAKLLQGTGKNLRHVKIRDKAQLVDANLRDLILSAVSLNRRDPRKSKILPTDETASAPVNVKHVFAEIEKIRRSAKKIRGLTATKLVREGRDGRGLPRDLLNRPEN